MRFFKDSSIKPFAISIVVCSILLCFVCVWFAMLSHVNAAVDENAPTFDTTYLEQWCHGDEGGTVRMIGAWFYNYEPSNQTYVLEDESGELWVVRNVGKSIGEEDFLLLWINDNNTPNDYDDDSIIKTWSEVHE